MSMQYIKKCRDDVHIKIVSVKPTMKNVGKHLQKRLHCDLLNSI